MNIGGINAAPLLPSPVPGQSGTQAPTIIPVSEVGPGTQTQIGGVVYNDSDLMTDEDYLLSLPPQVAALRNVDSQTAGQTPSRLALGQALLAAGFTEIDNVIMVAGEDAFLTMVNRSLDGFTGVPPFGASWQVIAVSGFSAPGLYGPGDVLPAGAIPVSFLKKDYPPFAAPVAPPSATPPVNPVGAQLPFTVGGKVAYSFAPLPGVSLAASFPPGTPGNAPGGASVAVKALPGLMGQTLVWVTQ